MKQSYKQTRKWHLEQKRRQRILILIVAAIVICTTPVLIYHHVHSNNVKTEAVVKKKTKSKDKKLMKEINAYLEDEGVDKGKVGIAIHDIDNNLDYQWYAEDEYVAGSTYKLPLAMIYYDMIASGKYKLTSKISVYAADYTEEGENYGVNTKVELQILLDNMILESDNTAAHILFDRLGGYKKFKKTALKYYNGKMDKDWINEDNTWTPAYMNDCLNYLYKYPKKYKTLINNMKKATPEAYLDKELKIHMAEKWGMSGAAVNAVGFVDGKHPYTIAVYTYGVADGETIMAHINKIAYNHIKK